MKRKTFYSIIQENGVTGIVEQDGFEIEIDGEKFNAYRNKYKDRAYIIDPKTGLAIETYDYDYEYDLPSEIEMIKSAREKLAENKKRLEKWREKRSSESYKLTVQMFAAYKRAEKLREKQKEAVRREIEADSKNGKGQSNGSF